MAAAAKNNNNKEVLQERNCTSENFYYLPRRFKNLAKPLLAAFQTCHPGTSAEVLNCFYTACTGWSFILPAERQSSTKLLSSFSSPLRLPYSYSTFFSLYSYFPLSLISLRFSMLTFILDSKCLSPSLPFSLFGSYIIQNSLALNSLLFPFSQANIIFAISQFPQRTFLS